MIKKEISSRTDTGKHHSPQVAQSGHECRKGAGQITGYIKFIPANLPAPRERSQIAILEHETARREMAYELHDSVNPLLCMAKLYLDQLTPITGRDVIAKKQVMELLCSAIQNVKRVSYDYSIFDRMNVAVIPLINDLVNKIEKLNLFKIDFTCSSGTALNKLSCYYKLVIHRIIQEQLNNIIKYSKAKYVSVKLNVCKGQLTLQITDDGMGFEGNRINSGIGFRSITKRIEQLGGNIQIEGIRGKGCRVAVSFFI